MKKIISMLIAIGMMVHTLPALADADAVSADFNAAASCVAVSGNVGGPCTLMVIVPKNVSSGVPMALEDIEDSIIAGNVLVFGEVKVTAENGDFEASFPMTKTGQDGSYTAFICSNSMETPLRATFAYVNEETLGDTLDDINSATSGNIISMINAHKGVLDLDTSEMNTVDANTVAANIILFRPAAGFTSPSEIQKGIDKGYALTVLNTSADAQGLQGNLNSFKDTLELDISAYENIGTDVTRATKQQAVCAAMLSKLPITDVKSFEAEVNNVAMKTDMATAEDWAYLQEMVTDTYKNELSIPASSWSTYELLIDKSAVFKELFRTSPADIETAFVQTVAARYAAENTVNRPSSGGGGGGGVSIKPSSNPIVTPTEPANKSFTDLDQAAWAEDDINALFEAGILAGDGSGSFYPNRTVTREELVTMVVKAFDLEPSGELDFKDVKVDAWYAENIKAAFAAGAISGVSENSFGVGMEITRQDLAAIIYRLAKLPAGSEVKRFADESEIAEYAKEAVLVLSSNGIISGMDENNFGPRLTATRAQVAVMLNRLLNLMEGNADA